MLLLVVRLFVLFFFIFIWQYSFFPKHSTYRTIPKPGCFHTSTFGAHPGSIDVRVRFVWMMWTLSSDLGCAPANRTRVRLRRVVWGTVHVNSGTVRCWCESIRTKSRKWTAINDVLFDKNICLCVFHSLSWRAASRDLYISFLFTFSVL